LYDLPTSVALISCMRSGISEPAQDKQK